MIRPKGEALADHWLGSAGYNEGMAVAAGLFGVAALVVVLVLLRDRWQRWWFELEDPRPLARFRIVFALLLLCEIAGLYQWSELLFEPDGMYTGAQARAIWGRGGDGLVDGAISLVTGHFSVLHYSEDPHAFDVAVVLFAGSTFLFMIGYRTRLTGLVSLLLLQSLLLRNRLCWDGTSTVFRVFFVYLVCSRCGETLSVDAWLARRRGATGPPALVPAWPRRLMIVQLCILMLTTGLLKHGGAWLDGDAVYYVLSYEHAARFRLHGLLAALGPAVFAVLTVFARAAEVFFPFVLVGEVKRWSAARFAPLQGGRRTAVYAALFVVVASAALAALQTGKPRLLPVDSAPLAAVAIVGLAGGTIWVWSSERAELLRRLYDRRLWLGVAALLFFGMWLLMNIGRFHPLMLATLLPLLARDAPPSAPLAYSRRTRAVGGVLLAGHLAAVCVTVPAPRSAAAAVVRPWLAATRTIQAWGMFRDPLHDNVFLRAVIFDASGQATDLRTDMYAEELRPPIRLGYDRRFKFNEQIVWARRSSPHPTAYARWLCRQHSGTVRIELRKLTVPIPTPTENDRLGGYEIDDFVRERGTEHVLLDHACR